MESLVSLVVALGRGVVRLAEEVVPAAGRLDPFAEAIGWVLLVGVGLLAFLCAMALARR